MEKKHCEILILWRDKNHFTEKCALCQRKWMPEFSRRILCLYICVELYSIGDKSQLMFNKCDNRKTFNVYDCMYQYQKWINDSINRCLKSFIYYTQIFINDSLFDHRTSSSSFALSIFAICQNDVSARIKFKKKMRDSGMSK